MRIRKNAKISPLIYAVASLKEGIIFKPHVCQLNQSPWDVLDFSPPPSQINRSGGSAVNGSSGGCVPVADRKPQPSEFPCTMQDHPPPPPQRVHKKDGETSQFQSRSKQHNSSKKSAKAAGEVAAPPRPTRPKKAPSTGPNDFYYYSGFGPRWGKERGESSRNNRHEMEIEAKKIEIEESKNVEYEEEVVVGKKRGRKPIKARSLKSLM